MEKLKFDSIENIAGSAGDMQNVGETYLETYRALEIESDEMLKLAGGWLKTLKGAMKELEAIRQKFVKPLNDHVKWINDQFRPGKRAMEEAEKVLKGKIRLYQVRQDEERRRISHEERRRVAAEKAALQAEIERAAEEGNEEEVEQLTLREMTTTPAVPPDTPKIDGVHIRRKWDFEVVDKIAFLKAVVDGLLPESYADVNMAAVRKVVRASGDIVTMPGIRIFEDETVVAHSD